MKDVKKESGKGRTGDRVKAMEGKGGNKEESEDLKRKEGKRKV